MTPIEASREVPSAPVGVDYYLYVSPGLFDLCSWAEGHGVGPVVVLYIALYSPPLAYTFRKKFSKIFKIVIGATGVTYVAIKVDCNKFAHSHWLHPDAKKPSKLFYSF